MHLWLTMMTSQPRILIGNGSCIDKLTGAHHYFPGEGEQEEKPKEGSGHNEGEPWGAHGGTGRPAVRLRNACHALPVHKHSYCPKDTTLSTLPRPYACMVLCMVLCMHA